MDRGIVELDVGGKVFRTTMSTLCSVDGYFARMLQNGNWADGKDGKPIFIDRGKVYTSSASAYIPLRVHYVYEFVLFADHTVFAGILTYLRSGQVLVSDVDDDVYVERLLIEADYYQLTALSDGLKIILSRRKQQSMEQGKTGVITQKVIGAADADRFLNIGWTFVGSYQGNETTSCSCTGSRVEAFWRMNQCTACGETMSFPVK